MFKNYIIGFLIVINLITATFCFRFHYRLVETRQQLESVRMELSAAKERQSEIAEILRRDGEIFRESSVTIAGIRSQIAAIRESYEAMEKLLLSSSTNSLHNNSNNNNTTEE